MKQLWVIMERDDPALDHGMIVCFDDKTRAIELANDWNSLKPGMPFTVVEFINKEG